MERLTKRLDNGEAVLDCDNCGLKKYRDCTLYGCRTRIMKCLAAYEDTGLTPETCAEYKKFEDEVVASGKTFGRLVELLHADKDGRCVVLPCKVGDTVWRIKRTFEEYPDKSKPYIEPDGFLLQDVFKTGKTVFLTREEAEHAMEGRKDG